MGSVARLRLVAVAMTLASTSSACASRTVRAEPFSRRVGEYLEMRSRVVARLGSPTAGSSARELGASTDTLATSIQQLRRGFGQGVIIPSAVAHDIRAAVAARLRQPDGPQLLAVIRDVGPTQFEPAINARYPDAEPRTTMPAQLLAVLPPVPPQLSYRFAGRRLLLLDRDTGVILDMVDDVLPDGTRPTQ